MPMVQKILCEALRHATGRPSQKHHPWCIEKRGRDGTVGWRENPLKERNQAGHGGSKGEYGGERILVQHHDECRAENREVDEDDEMQEAGEVEG